MKNAPSRAVVCHPRVAIARRLAAGFLVFLVGATAVMAAPAAATTDLEEEIARLAHGHWRTRCAAIDALGALDPHDTPPPSITRAIDALLGALEQASPHVREHAAYALGNVARTPEHVVRAEAALLPHTIQRPDDDVMTRQARIAAVFALGQMGTPRAADALLTALRDSHLPSTGTSLAAIARRHPDAFTGQRYAQVLRSIGPGRQTGAREVWSILARDPSPELATLLAALDDPEHPSRRQVPSLLARVEPRTDAIRERLLAAAADETPAVRAASLAHLPTAPDVRRRARRRLLAASRDTETEVRKAAIGALAQRTHPRTTWALMRLMHDDEPSIRAHARRSVARIAPRWHPRTVALVWWREMANRNMIADVLAMLLLVSLIPVAAWRNRRWRLLLALVLVGTPVLTFLRLYQASESYAVALLLGVMWPVLAGFVVVRWSITLVIVVLRRRRRRRTARAARA